jgi:hypothetical protein
VKAKKAATTRNARTLLMTRNYERKEA